MELHNVDIKVESAKQSAYVAIDVASSIFFFLYPIWIFILWIYFMIRFFFFNNEFVSRNLESIPVTFWTSHQLITRPQQPSALALTPSANLEFPVSLTCTSVECGKEPVGTTQTLGKHTNNKQKDPRPGKQTHNL